MIFAIFGRSKQPEKSKEILLSLLDSIQPKDGEGRWSCWTSCIDGNQKFVQIFQQEKVEHLKYQLIYDYDIVIAHYNHDIRTTDKNHIAIACDANGNVDVKDKCGKMTFRNSRLAPDLPWLLLQNITEHQDKVNLCGDHQQDGQRSIWIFQKGSAKLDIIDHREELGQIFVSNQDTLNNAIYKIAAFKSTIEFPENYLWKLMFHQNQFSWKKYRCQYNL